MSAEGQAQGLGVDILTRLAKRNGDTIRFELYPWTRAQLMVEQGRADILIGPYKNAQRVKMMSFFEYPFYQDEMVFYRLIGAPTRWNGEYASLVGMRIAKVKSWAYGTSFMSQAKELGVQDFTTLSGALVRLGRGDLDLVASNVRNTQALLKEMVPKIPVEVIRPIIALQQGYFAFNHAPLNAELKMKYDKAFTQMVLQGELKLLGEKNGVMTP